MWNFVLPPSDKGHNFIWNNETLQVVGIGGVWLSFVSPPNPPSILLSGPQWSSVFVCVPADELSGHLSERVEDDAYKKRGGVEGGFPSNSAVVLCWRRPACRLITRGAQHNSPRLLPILWSIFLFLWKIIKVMSRHFWTRTHLLSRFCFLAQCFFLEKRSRPAWCFTRRFSSALHRTSLIDTVSQWTLLLDNGPWCRSVHRLQMRFNSLNGQRERERVRWNLVESQNNPSNTIGG